MSVISLFCPGKKIWWILTACKLNLKLTDDDLENFVSFIYDLDLESYIKKTCLQSQRTVLTKIDNFKDRAQNYFDNHSLEIPFMPGNFHDDLIFTFFLLSFLYRKIFNAQKLYPVLLGI